MGRKKKCIVITSFADDQPGFLDFSYRIRTLSELYDLTIVSQVKLDQSELQVEATYIQLGKISNKLSWIRFIWKAAKYIRKSNADVVVILHSYLAPITLCISTPNALYWNEHPTNLMHLPNKQSFIKYFVTKICHKLFYMGAKRATLLMPIGEEQYAELLTKGCDISKIKLIYMGVSESFVRNEVIKELPSPVLRLIYTGSICVPRGRDVMLNAMVLVAEKNIPVHLTMVGAPPDELEYCHDFIKEHKLEKYLIVIGRVPGSEIPQFLNEADYGICLWEDRVSWRFNPPTKLFEYLVAGLPVLASNIRTHTRYIDHGVNGFIFDYDSYSLANVIEVAYKNLYRSEQLREGAKNSGSKYLWNKVEPIFIKSMQQLESL